MSRVAPRFRAVMALAAAAFAVHQLRYALAYSGDGAHALAAQGHRYLDVFGPLIVGGLAVAAMQLAHALTRARGVVDRAPRWRTLWLQASVAVLCVYAGQELVEGFLAQG